MDFDKPGLAQFYCVHCAKHFINERAFKDHIKGKPHKRRLHALETEPYTIEESERAAGNFSKYRGTIFLKCKFIMHFFVLSQILGA